RAPVDGPGVKQLAPRVDRRRSGRRAQAGRSDLGDRVADDQDVGGVGPVRADVEDAAAADDADVRLLGFRRGSHGDGLASAAVADHGKKTRSTITSAWKSTMPMIESRIMAPNATGVLKNAVDDVMRYPRPRFAATNSPTTAPTTDSVIATLSPLKMNGTA